MSEVQRSATAKFRWRVLLPIVVLIVLSSLDRVNISFAALQMNDDIGLSPESYGFAVSIFFVGYLLFQFPSTWALTRIGARRWITGCVIIWGTVATLMAFVRRPEELYVLRFLLGCAESGFAPGIVYYCSGWMPARYRANTIAVTMIAIPISVIIGGPLCGWLMDTTNPLEVAGWRWMFFMTGTATVVMGFAAYFIFVDKPSQARWLNADEKGWIAGELERDQQHSSPPPKAPLTSVVSDARAWLAAGVWCTTLIGANGMMFWLPQVIKQMSSSSDLVVGAISALPWVGVGLGMIINSWHSDKTQERFWHVGLAMALAMIGLFAASIVPAGPLALFLLFVGGVGLGSAQGVFWSIPTTFFHRSVAAAGITLINLVGNIGSLTGPYVIGVIRENSDSFAAPIWFVASVMGIGAVLLASLHRQKAKLITVH